MSQNLDNYSIDYYARAIDETWFWQNGLLRPDQLACLCYAFGRPFFGDEGLEARLPRKVVSVGAGRGELEKELERLGVSVVGVDPSEGAQSLYEGHTLTPEYAPQGEDTLIFCESIEHIPSGVREAIWKQIQPGTRVIIANWPTNHPITPDGSGWDHITPVNDELYDLLSQHANVRVRRGSFLVLDFD